MLEEASTFATALDGKDECSFHTDHSNCPLDTCNFTCCAATTVESKATGCLCRVVANLNSRSVCGRAMASETKHTFVYDGLKTEMDRINSSYKEVYGNQINAPAATTFTSLHLTNNLPQGKEKKITLASARLRDLFMSAAAPTVCSLQEKEEKSLGCCTIVGLLLIAIHMSSHQQPHMILLLEIG
jgi:hypothetical protein